MSSDFLMNKEFGSLNEDAEIKLFSGILFAK
jgi:hypothetical protein